MNGIPATRRARRRGRAVLVGILAGLFGGCVRGIGGLGGAGPGFDEAGLPISVDAAADDGAHQRDLRSPELRECPEVGPQKNLTDCDFRGADLAGESFDGANLSGSSFAGADLCGATFRGANLDDVDLSGANLTRADLSAANLSSAKLTGAIRCRTRLPSGMVTDPGCPDPPCCRDEHCGDGGVCQRSPECSYPAIPPGG